MQIIVSPLGPTQYKIDFDSEADRLFQRVLTEKSGGASTVLFLDNLMTTWMRQHLLQFQTEDFQKLTPKQREDALIVGRATPP